MSVLIGEKKKINKHVQTQQHFPPLGLIPVSIWIRIYPSLLKCDPPKASGWLKRAASPATQQQPPSEGLKSRHGYRQRQRPAGHLHP